MKTYEQVTMISANSSLTPELRICLFQLLRAKRFHFNQGQKHIYSRCLRV